LGYRWHEKRFEINPDEAPLRRLVYELFKEHKRLKTVAELLNAAGYRSRKGKPFRDTAVERLLTTRPRRASGAPITRRWSRESAF
jgi:site-specific DNA recombinase